MPRLDFLYMTRVQRERFFNEEDYVRLKDFYILNKEKMALAKQDMLVLHPLPRVNEISVEVDDDPRPLILNKCSTACTSVWPDSDFARIYEVKTAYTSARVRLRAEASSPAGIKNR